MPVTVAGVPKSETTMKKFPLLVTTSIGLLGVFVATNAFATQVSDHGGGVTVTIPDDDSQDATTTGENEHVATESDDSSDDHDGVDTGEHHGDQGDDEGGHESGDHNGGDHESGDHDGDHAGGDGGGGGGGDGGGGDGGGDD